MWIKRNSCEVIRIAYCSKGKYYLLLLSKKKIMKLLCISFIWSFMLPIYASYLLPTCPAWDRRDSKKVSTHHGDSAPPLWGMKVHECKRKTVHEPHQIILVSSVLIHMWLPQKHLREKITEKFQVQDIYVCVEVVALEMVCVLIPLTWWFQELRSEDMTKYQCKSFRKQRQQNY